MKKRETSAWARGCALEIMRLIGMVCALTGGIVTLVLSGDYVLSFLVALVVFGLWLICLEAAQDAHPLR